MGVSNRNGVWYVKWRRADGAWCRRATTAVLKKQALVMHAELVRQAERQRAGLEPMPSTIGLTLSQLCKWWLQHFVGPRSLKRVTSMLKVHVHGTELGRKDVKQVSAEVLDAYFDQLEAEGYTGTSINLLRANLRAIFNKARKAKKLTGDNPATASKYRTPSASTRPTLSAAEVELVLAKVPEQWRPFFATACFLGLRKGELCGLRKSDYDIARRTITVQRSYDNEGTKGKRVDVLPVVPALAQHLAEALKTPGHWLLPGPDGKMRDDNTAPQDILRAAMKRAGLIEGWNHTCRRCQAKLNKKYREQNGAKATDRNVQSFAPRVKPVFAKDDQVRKCADCGMVLKPVALVRPITFHDLRHTCATLLLKAGVPVQHVQRILRHSTIAITVNTYGHLLTEDLRWAAEKLGPQSVQQKSSSNVG